MLLKQDELVLAIKEMITRHPGQRLPSERSLAVNLGVSRARIRQVLDRLESEQLVTRQRGSGNYAVDLRKDRLTTVGILVDRQLKLGNDPFYSMLLEQLQSALQHEGIRSVIERIDKNTKLPEEEDALIIMGMAGNEVISTQRLGGPPILGIFLDAKPQPGSQVSILQVDNFDAGYQAAKYLYSLGVKSFCFVGPNHIPASRDRYLGAKRFCEEQGHDLEHFPCRMNYTGGLSAGQEILKNDQITTKRGLITANDWTAIGLHSAMIAFGKELRDQHVLVSFDGLPITNDPNLAIHTMAIPLRSIIQDSVAELQRYLDQPTASGRVLNYRLEWSTDMKHRLAFN